MSMIVKVMTVKSMSVCSQIYLLMFISCYWFGVKFLTTEAQNFSYFGICLLHAFTHEPTGPVAWLGLYFGAEVFLTIILSTLYYIDSQIR
jgi:hypothetical protein